MAKSLSPGELQKGRKNFMFFVLINNYAYYALAGNIITLLALRINASNLAVGIISSFIFISYLFLIPGRTRIRKVGTVKLLHRYYLMRNLLMLPILLVPLLAFRAHPVISLGILILFSFLFNAARGMHLTSDNPLMAELGGENEQGSFLSRTLVASYLVCMGAALVMYFLLGKEPPLYMYSIIIGSGILAGITASGFLPKIPEPLKSAPEISENLLSGFLRAIRQSNLRVYFIILFLCFMCISMIGPFIVVYFTKVFGAGDNHIMLFTLAGNAGSLFMAVLSGFVIDKLGAKPLYFAFAGITLATLVPALAGFSVKSQSSLIVFGSILFFFQMMGTAGTYNAGRTYLLSALERKDQLNFGVLYFVVIGIGGAIGSFLGGILIDLFLNQGFSQVNAFRLFFGVIAALYIFIILLIARLRNTAPYSIRSALLYILSPRDLRALSLLKRLDETKSLSEEKDVIQALKRVPSALSTENLIQKLKSPSFEIRIKSLDAFYSLPPTADVKEALMSEVKNHPFTTAYIAAEILGEHRVRESAKVLRQAIWSKDYYLAGKSMVALARLEAEEAYPDICKLFSETRNPRLIIHGAKALEYFGYFESVPLFIAKLTEKPFPFIRDEIILAIAGLLDLFGWFYPFYVAFLEKAGTGILMLKDEVSDGRFPVPLPMREKLNALLDLLLNQEEAFVAQLFLFMDELKVAGKPPDEKYKVLFDGLRNQDIIKLVRFRFLAGAALVRFVKNTRIYERYNR